MRAYVRTYTRKHRHAGYVGLHVLRIEYADLWGGCLYTCSVSECICTHVVLVQAADASCSSSPVVDESCFLAKERNVGSKTIAVPGSTRAHSRYHTKTANQYFASIHKEDIKKPRRPSAAPQPDATGPTPEKTAEEQEVLEAKEDEDRQNPSHSMLDAILEHLSEEDRRALDPSKVPELSKEHLGEAADFFKPRKNKKKDDDSAEEGLSLTAAQRMLTLIEMWNASSKEERLEFLKRLIQTTKEKLGGGGGGGRTSRRK